MTLLTILIVIAAALLILVVLIQNPKGGGLAANFSAGNNIVGVKKANELIEKITWGLIAAVIALTLLTGFFMPTANSGEGSGSAPKSQMQDEIDSRPSIPQGPGLNQPTPQNQGTEEAP